MIQRTFIPGSQWLYIKVYTGTKTADDILIHTIYPYVRDLYSRNIISNYFFIRYSDPDFHIRLRLYITDSNSYSEVMRKFVQLFQHYIDDGMVSKIMCDTYVRELERYGAESIELIEMLFRIDSDAILELLSLLVEVPSEHQEQFRWQLSLLLLDDTLTAFNYNLEGKARLTNRMADSFKQEFGFSSHTYTKQLNDKYRISRKEIEQGISTRYKFETFENALKTRRDLIAGIVHKLNSVKNVDEDVISQEDLIPSIQHMTMNRWFRSRNRICELVVYDFLKKYYGSSLALILKRN